MNQPAEQDASGDVGLLQPQGDFLGRHSFSVTEAQALALLFGKACHCFVQPLLPLVADDGHRRTGHAGGKQSDEVLAGFPDRNVPRNLASAGPLAGGEVTVAVDNTLFGQLTEPAEWIAAGQIGVGKFAQGLDREFLQNIGWLDLAAEIGAQPAFNKCQQSRPTLVEEIGEGGRVALANPFDKWVGNIVGHDRTPDNLAWAAVSSYIVTLPLPLTFPSPNPFAMMLTATFTPTPIDDAWDALSELLEAFAKAWESGAEPPNPATFLPTQDAAARRLALVELIKLDQDNRLQRGLEQPLEHYLQAFPELAQGGLPCDLLYEDFHLRRQAGQAVDPADYYQRFPSVAKELARLLGSDEATHSTSVAVSVARLSLVPGDRIDDFDLLTLLGEGQFARVFLARQRSMQRLLALKVSAVRGAEAQTLAQLDHPNIVRVYDQRLLPEQGLQLVYMPYLPGGTLLNILHRAREVRASERTGRTLLEAVDGALHSRGEVPPAMSGTRLEWAGRSWARTICALGAKLAAALDYAHQRGVLHRDLKPANVLLTADGEPLLADFNIGCCSKLEGAGPSAMFGGSLPYMAPEHLEAFNPAHSRLPESLDGRADIFGLAVTLWELLSGHRPFAVELRSSAWPEMLEEMIVVRAAGPSEVSRQAISDGDVPGLRDVLLRCLEANPDLRPATAGEMARELELCLRPATRKLLRPKPGGWPQFVRQHPFLSLMLAGLIPNVLAAIFNIVYNEAEIVAHWDEAKSAFESIVPPINGVLFAIGISIMALSILPVARELRRLRGSGPTDEKNLSRLRRRCLRLGSIAALVCVVTWAAAGLIWPIVLRMSAAPPPQGMEAYIHFLLSLVICGLIAAAYPYFLITFLAVRVLYPALVGPGGLDSSDDPALRRVERELSRFRAAAAAVPLIAVAMLASRGASETYAVAILSVTGLAGTLLAFALEGRTRADLKALSDR